MDLDLERWICMVLEWLAYSRIDLSLLQHQSTYQLREACEPPDIFQHQSTGYLRTRGQETLCETCACIIHTNLPLHVHYYSAI